MSIVNSKCNFLNCASKEIGLNALASWQLEALYRTVAADGMRLYDLSLGAWSEIPFYGFIPHSDDVVLTQLMMEFEGGSSSVLDEMGLSGETLTTSDPAIMAPIHTRFDYIEGTGKVWLLFKNC